MAELFRILSALFALFMQQMGGGPSPFPIVRASTATPVLTATPTLTPTRTRTATNTVPPTATPTKTFTPRPPGANDPLGFEAPGEPPAQKLPSALLIFPLIRVSATQETRIEIVNLTGSPVSLQCFYVASLTCNEIGFFMTMTANQPISWLASSGFDGNGNRLAPPFNGDGELKCVVVARTPDLSSHNALQGRALVTESGKTIGYAAIAFRRLSPGTFNGSIPLDGVTYEQCPDRLHFHALSSKAGADSDLIFVPCSQDLVLQTQSSSTVQFAVINEFEQVFSASTTIRCFNRVKFSSISSLRRTTAGTDTIHLIARGVNDPIVGLVIDRFTVPGSGAPAAASNSPYLEGGRSADGVNLP